MVLKLFIKKYGVYKVIKQQQKQQQRKKNIEEIEMTYSSFWLIVQYEGKD